jgi:hypothetical protein
LCDHRTPTTLYGILIEEESSGCWMPRGIVES